MWVAQDQDYKTTLLEFRTTFNRDERVKKLVKNWDRLVLLDATDTGSKYGLVVKGQECTEVTEIGDDSTEHRDDVVHLQADEEVLKEIFSGRYDPAAAIVNGALGVFSADGDKVKLEAIAFLMWKLKLA